MSDTTVQKQKTEKDYGDAFQTKIPVKMIKKDGSKEDFNVQKVIDAVGKSAYRALTKFTDEEKAFDVHYTLQQQR